jgi:hypothetical protein
MFSCSKIVFRQGIVSIFLLGLASAADAETCRKDSPAHKVALVELYTSEGCSSCPPADRWLSALVKKPQDERIVALALHVDYWDSLGWRDRFASPVFTQRQNALTKLSRARFAYTPEVFLGLREFRNWSVQSDLENAVRAINMLPAQADITLSLQAGARANERVVHAMFRLKPGTAALQARGFVAIYEDMLSSAVERGENQGATLHHDRVVRQWLGPLPLREGAADIQRTIAIPSDWQADHLGVAAFVEDPSAGAILQASSLQGCRTSGG